MDNEKQVIVLNGDWSNGSCLGYAIMAMEKQGFSKQQIKTVTSAMKWQFETKTIEQADQHYCNSIY